MCTSIYCTGNPIIRKNRSKETEQRNVPACIVCTDNWNIPPSHTRKTQQFFRVKIWVFFKYIKNKNKKNWKKIHVCKEKQFNYSVTLFKKLVTSLRLLDLHNILTYKKQFRYPLWFLRHLVALTHFFLASLIVLVSRLRCWMFMQLLWWHRCETTSQLALSAIFLLYL